MLMNYKILFKVRLKQNLQPRITIPPTSLLVIFKARQEELKTSTLILFIMSVPVLSGQANQLNSTAPEID